MKHSAVVVIFLLVAAFSVGIVTAVTAGEPFSGPIQQMEGQIKALNFACHAAPSVCKGSLVVAEQHRGDVPLVIHPGMQIRRWEQSLTLHELKLGAPIKAFTFQMSAKAYVQAVRQGGAQVGGVMLPQPFGVWGLPAEELAKLPGYGDPEQQKEEARRLLKEVGYGPTTPYA